MEREDFFKEVTKKLGDRLGNRYILTRQDIGGLNGTKKHSLLVMDKWKDTNIYPCIRMDDYFRTYRLSVCSIDKIVADIASECQKENSMQNMDISCFVEWDLVRYCIYGKLINTAENRCFLKDVPYREYLDLSFVYYAGIYVGEQKEFAVIQIRKEHMQFWGVDEDRLYKEAVKNMDDEADFNSMENIINQLAEEHAFRIDGQIKFPMFILSNKRKLNGAAQICNTRAMREIARYFSDDFWILPSSVHEVILIPCRWSAPQKENFAEIVRYVNHTQVLPQDVLSYHVYRYHIQTGEMTIEA